MPRIKKRGLNYYPLDVDFLQKRSIRRILKREGDGAIAALLSLYAAIYTGEGYYVKADETLCEDLADSLYTLEADDVKRVLQLALEGGLFDEGLYRQWGILTSRDIQQQYLFAKRGAKPTDIDPRYNLLPDETPATPATDAPAQTEATASAPAGTDATPLPDRPAAAVENVTEMPINATENGINAPKTYPGTHSIVKHSIEKHRKPLLTGSPGGTGSAGRMPAAEQVTEEVISTEKRLWTQADIDRLQPPDDGLPRNLEGLRLNLREHRIPPAEQRAIILMSNFGVIGHPVWRGFGALRESHGKIRQPGRYLLSLCVKRGGKPDS